LDRRAANSPVEADAAGLGPVLKRFVIGTRTTCM
jgi:hypothetical protein